MQSNTIDGAATLSGPAPTRPRGKLSTGILISIGLHVAAALVLALALIVSPAEAPLIIPVDVIQLADQTSSPPEVKEAVVPTQGAAAPSSPEANPVMLAPTATRTPPDKLDIKLRELAQLRQPILDQDLSKTGEGLARISTTRQDALPGSEAAFKNFLRDQIEHHWGLDLAAIHGRDISVALRIRITRAGLVTGADVLNKREAGVDPVFDEAARSARNAALLSSPLALPPGRYPEIMDVILTLNTRDALR